MNQDECLFSICVLTFNRGRKALNIAETLLPIMDDNWELLFLDNCSFLECPEYQTLAELAEQDPRLSYIRHPFNRQFPRNYLASFELAKAPYVMVLSDEDFANPEMIRTVIPLLHQYPTVGIMRGSIGVVEGVEGRNSFDFADASYRAGEEALLGFYQQNNYFSGTIYNRQLLNSLGLVQKLAERIDDYGVAIYPHSYLELLACALTDVVTTEQIACFEGPEQALPGNTPNQYVQPYSFGSRVDQFIIMRDTLIDAVSLMGEAFDKALFVTLYLKLCEKYMYLITYVNAPMYESNLIHPGLLHQAFFLIANSAVADYADLAEYRPAIQEELKRIRAKYDFFA